MQAPVTMLCLAALLACAVYNDLRFHRISNELTVLGLVVALGLHTVGGGLRGVTSGLLGAAVGLVCFAPFYLLRAMGAGDVKLLAAVGAFLGPIGALFAALFSLLAGGLGALGYVLWRALRASVTPLVREGFAAAATAAVISARLARRHRLPFALPIAVGGIAAGWQLADSTPITAWIRGTLTSIHLPLAPSLT
jgi:prepilin peptidase CpaA